MGIFISIKSQLTWTDPKNEEDNKGYLNRIYWKSPWEQAWRYILLELLRSTWLITNYHQAVPTIHKWLTEQEDNRYKDEEIADYLIEKDAEPGIESFFLFFLYFLGLQFSARWQKSKNFIFLKIIEKTVLLLLNVIPFFMITLSTIFLQMPLRFFAALFEAVERWGERLIKEENNPLGYIPKVCGFFLKQIPHAVANVLADIVNFADAIIAIPIFICELSVKWLLGLGQGRSYSEAIGMECGVSLSRALDSLVSTSLRMFVILTALAGFAAIILLLATPPGWVAAATGITAAVLANLGIINAVVIGSVVSSVLYFLVGKFTADLKDPFGQEDRLIPNLGSSYKDMLSEGFNHRFKRLEKYVSSTDKDDRNIQTANDTLQLSEQDHIFFYLILHHVGISKNINAELWGYAEENYSTWRQHPSITPCETLTQALLQVAFVCNKNNLLTKNAIAENVTVEAFKEAFNEASIQASPNFCTF